MARTVPLRRLFHVEILNPHPSWKGMGLNGRGYSRVMDSATDSDAACLRCWSRIRGEGSGLGFRLRMRSLNCWVIVGVMSGWSLSLVQECGCQVGIGLEARLVSGVNVQVANDGKVVPFKGVSGMYAHTGSWLNQLVGS